MSLASASRSRACWRTRAILRRPSQPAKNAWRSWRVPAYDVVLLDVWLPGMDGLETLARIQEIPFADRPGWSSSPATAPSKPR